VRMKVNDEPVVKDFTGTGLRKFRVKWGKTTIWFFQGGQVRRGLGVVGAPTIEVPEDEKVKK